MMTTNLYTNCDLPLERYIRLVVDGDITALVIDAAGEQPTEAELRQAEIEISSEFAVLTGNQKATNLHETVIRLCELKARVISISVMVAAMKGHPVHKIIQALKAEDFDVELDPADPAQFAADLERILIELKGDEVEILQLTAQLEAAREQASESGLVTITRQYFDDMLLAFEDMMKVQYDISTLTLRKYAGLSRRFQQIAKTQSRYGRGK